MALTLTQEGRVLVPTGTAVDISVATMSRNGLDIHCESPGARWWVKLDGVAAEGDGQEFNGRQMWSMPLWMTAGQGSVDKWEGAVSVYARSGDQGARSDVKFWVIEGSLLR